MQWSVPERSGSGLRDGNAIMWMYHSHYNESADIYTGLAGPLIVYKKGVLHHTTGLPTDVDKEFVLLYEVFAVKAYVLYSMWQFGDCILISDLPKCV
jgi:manganese oxidase